MLYQPDSGLATVNASRWCVISLECAYLRRVRAFSAVYWGPQLAWKLLTNERGVV